MEPIKKIIVPTDFTVKSLNLVREAIELLPDEKINITLLYGFYPPSSITDLLFFSKTKLIEGLQTPAFVDACRVIKSKYQSKLNSLCVDVVTANRKSYFENYLQANKITEAFVPVNFKMQLGKDGFDVVPTLLASNIKVTALDWEAKASQQEVFSNQVSDLFEPLTPIIQTV